jgi:cytochrome c oxidase cbb3-type subunit 4
MDLYTLTRHFADSWGLLALFAVFVVVVIWAFRPGSRSAHADVANIPFRHEDKPARADETTGATFKEAWK